jgi:DNA-binding transcriptional regulator of glucitol operon
LLRHLLALVLISACLGLGWWQVDRARAPDGTLQNLGYALEWPAFAIFVVFVWWRLLRIELNPPAVPETVSQRRALTPPQPEPRAPRSRSRRGTGRRSGLDGNLSAKDQRAEEQLAEYNRHLAWLNGTTAAANTTKPARIAGPIDNATEGTGNPRA